MLIAWSTSEKLRLLILHKEGVKWPALAEKMNEVYKERPANFFNEKNCEAELKRILNEPCPKPIAPNEPSSTSYSRATVIDAWMDDLRGKINTEYDTRIETTLVDFRKMTELIERLMSKDNRPSMEEMKAKLEQINEENMKRSRSAEETAQLERVISVLRARISQIFKERREANNDADKALPPGSLSISPTKASSIALQNAFRSPSPIKSPITSPIRPLAEAIEEANAVLGVEEEEMEETEEVPEEIENEEAETEDEPKMEVDTQVASPLNRITSPIASPIVAHIPSPISSPIRSHITSPIASPIRSAVVSPIRSPIATSDEKRDKEKSVSPRTAAERAIGDGGLEEEMEEEDDEEVKEESMEVDEKVEEIVKEKEEVKKEETADEQKPMVTRKSTRVSSMSVDTTPSTSGKEKKRKDPSPIESAISKKEEKEKEKKEETKVKEEEKVKEKKKEETKEEEPPVRRASMRGRPPSTPIVHSAHIHSSEEEKEEEKGTVRGRRSSRVEKVEDKKEDKKEEKKKEDEKKEEEKDDKKRTRGSMGARKTEEKEKEVKEEATFVAPTVASRTRQHRGSEQTDDKEKEKSEEPIGSKTRSSGRHSLSGKSTSESKESPAPPERRTRRGEKKEESEEKEIRGGKETSVANSDKNTQGGGGKKDVQSETEVSIRHHLVSTAPMSPSKTRRGTERESPVARKASRASTCSSTNGKPSMVSVEVQTDAVEFKHDDVVFYQYNDNEKCFHPVIEIEQRGRGRPRKIEKEREKEIKTETDEEKPISRRTRGGETSEDEGGSRSGSFSQSDKGTPSRRREAKKENTRENMMTLRLDLDDDTGRYWLEHNGASHVDIIEGPSSAKKRSLQSEMSSGGRRSMVHMDPLTHALYKACKDLDLHRHSSVFKANVPHKDAPDYYDCVHFPMSLSKLKTEVSEGTVNDPVSLQRKLQIMFMNGAMYNSTAHDYWGYAVEMYKETFKPIKEIMPEMMVEEEEAPKQTRTRRNNEPAFAKDAVLCERDRSITHDRTVKCESEDADDHHMDTSSEDNRTIYSRTKVDYTRKRRL